MRKQSQMGASKYEFNPEQFDEDIASNENSYEAKKSMVSQKLYEIIESDPAKIDETYYLLIVVMKEIKRKFNL